jgi:hypothetical protein
MDIATSGDRLTSEVRLRSQPTGPTSQWMPSSTELSRASSRPTRPSPAQREPRSLPRTSHQAPRRQPPAQDDPPSRDPPEGELRASPRDPTACGDQADHLPADSIIASQRYRIPQRLDSGAAHGLRSCSAFLAASASHAGHVPPCSSIARPIASRALAHVIATFSQALADESQRGRTPFERHPRRSAWPCLTAVVGELAGSGELAAAPDLCREGSPLLWLRGPGLWRSTTPQAVSLCQRAMDGVS